MKKSLFGKTGFQVTPLGLGGAEIGFNKPEVDAATKLLNTLLDKGVNVIDTAAGYANSEELIGNAIGHRRSEFVLISKCGHPDATLPGTPWSGELITQTVDRALKRLKTNVLDVMLLHTCKEDVLRKGDALAALVKARDAGKVRFVGYSGDNQEAAYAASLPDVSVIETSINLVDQVNIDLVLPVARKNNIGVLAKRPIANACWKELSTQPGFYKDYAKAYTERLAKMKISPAEMGIAGPKELAWPELALRFTISQPGVHTAIIGTVNLQNTLRNIEFIAKGPLPQPVVAKIQAIFKTAQAGETWAGLQ